MMTFITLSCNHHFVTYITYYSSKKIAQKIEDYCYKCAKFNEEGLCLKFLALTSALLCGGHLTPDEVYNGLPAQ